ncbi:piRNA biogenesis protein EXD1 isoform X1 [Pogona vitticeps]
MDPSSDYHFLHDILGKTVKVTLKCGTFQGVLQHVDSTQTIFLKRVRNLENGRHVPGIKMFFGHEIINVELLEDLLQRGAEEKPTLSTYREVPAAKFSAEDKEELIKQGAQHPGTVSQEKQQPLLGYVTYNFAGEEKAEDIEFVVIDQFQKKFGYAMMHIKKQTVCGIAAEGVGLCRHGKLSWLQVATRSQIFLFDIFLLGARAFKNGLQMILEDRNVLKVIHDCRWLSDCLSHQYGILLSNVFDTQVADVLQFSKETGGFLPHCISTLQECLMRYLKMPYKNVSFMEQRQSEIEKNPEIWFVRPLPPALLNVLALETAYLLPLRLLLLDEIMSDLTALVDGYLNAFREGSGDPLGSIEISCMKLPQELRQLADIHKARRENAVQKFQLNEEGLLIRKDMEHLKSKWVQEERNKTGGRDLILSSYTTSPKVYNVSCVHNRNLAGQNNSVKEQKVCKYGSTSGDADGDGRTESEVKTMTVSCKSISRA